MYATPNEHTSVEKKERIITLGLYQIGTSLVYCTDLSSQTDELNSQLGEIIF